jgi:hypothetical protein
VLKLTVQRIVPPEPHRERTHEGDHHFRADALESVHAAEQADGRCRGFVAAQGHDQQRQSHAGRIHIPQTTQLHGAARRLHDGRDLGQLGQRKAALDEQRIDVIPGRRSHRGVTRAGYVHDLP